MRPSLNMLLPLLVAALSSSSVLAADNGFYVGASAGQSSFVTGDLGDVDFDGDATGYKVFGGYRFLTFVGVEASYVDFGDIEDAQDATGYQADVNGLTLEAVGYLPLGIADLFVKAGYFQWDATLSSIEGLTGSISADGSDIVYGAGFQFRIRSFAVRAEVELFEVESADELYMYSLGGSYTF